MQQLVFSLHCLYVFFSLFGQLGLGCRLLLCRPHILQNYPYGCALQSELLRQVVSHESNVVLFSQLFVVDEDYEGWWAGFCLDDVTYFELRIAISW